MTAHHRDYRAATPLPPIRTPENTTRKLSFISALANWLELERRQKALDSREQQLEYREREVQTSERLIRGLIEKNHALHWETIKLKQQINGIY